MSKLPIELTYTEYYPAVWENTATFDTVLDFNSKRDLLYKIKSLNTSISTINHIVVSSNLKYTKTLQDSTVSKNTLMLLSKRFKGLIDKITIKISDLKENIKKLSSFEAVKDMVDKYKIENLMITYNSVNDTLFYGEEKINSLVSKYSLLDIDMDISLQRFNQLINTIKILESKSESHIIRTEGINKKMRTLMKFSKEIKLNTNVINYLLPILENSFKNLKDKIYITEKQIEEYESLIVEIRDLYNSNIDDANRVNEEIQNLDAEIDKFKCFLDQSEEQVISTLDNCLVESKKIIDEYYQLFIGSNFLKAGDYVEYNRVGCYTIINAYLPKLPECPMVVSPPVLPNVVVRQGPLNSCPPPVCGPAYNHTNECEIEILDKNENRIIDDDLDLYIDGVFIKTFVGSIDPFSKHTIKIDNEGTYKVELKFNKSNNKDTFKQLVFKVKSTGKILHKSNLMCYSTTKKDTVVFSKTIEFSCF